MERESQFLSLTENRKLQLHSSEGESEEALLCLSFRQTIVRILCPVLQETFRLFRSHDLYNSWKIAPDDLQEGHIVAGCNS